jgi:Pyruvate/2-oxoacid:ferredoxin oxidoreductase gamma subunit
MKAMVGLVLAILIIFSLRLFWPSTEFDLSEMPQTEASSDNIDEQVNASEVTTNETDSSLAELNASSGEEKTKLMTAEYEILEQERKKLKRHLAQLKHEMWGLKFTPEKAKKISTSVMSASRLLNNPPMLGAFLSVGQIKDEIVKVNFAEKSLEEVDEIIKAKIEEGSSGAN